jgi:hypothetical protein
LKPNQELTLTMTTGDNSQISMSAVDQNVLLENQGNDLSRNKVYNELRLYDNAGDADLDASYTESYSKLLVSCKIRYDFTSKDLRMTSFLVYRNLEPS